MKDFKTLFRLGIQKCFKNKEIIRFERIYVYLRYIYIYIYFSYSNPKYIFSIYIFI